MVPFDKVLDGSDWMCIQARLVEQGLLSVLHGGPQGFAGILRFLGVGLVRCCRCVGPSE